LGEGCHEVHKGRGRAHERLGGKPRIEKFVDQVVENHMLNPVIQARFLPYRDDAKKLAAIKEHVCAFLCAGTGGPEKYSGRDMRMAHRGMNISEQEYMAVLDDILNAAIKQDYDDQTRKDLLAIAYSLKGDVMRL
jgi:hemoglobin